MSTSSEVSVVDPDDKVDEVRLFMLYALFGGDVRRVAVVSRVDAKRVESLAHDFRWKDKLSGRGSLDNEKGQDDERALNRVSSYVTSERLSRVFARLIDELDSDPTFARQFCTVTDNDTKETSFNTKNLVELSKGLQLCQDMKYRALQDKQAQAADVVGKAIDASSIALATYRALAARFDHNETVDTVTEIVKAVSDVRTEVEEKAVV